MNSVKDFLQVLSSVMKDDGRTERFGEYVSLYSQINQSLFDTLSHSLYPNAPAIIKKLNDALGELNCLSLCKEIIGRKTMLLSLDKSGNGLEILNNARIISSQDIASITCNISEIPIIVYNSSETEISALNYADIRIKLSPENYEILTTGCEEQGIGLSKIINCIFIGIPMNLEDMCFVLTGRNYRDMADKLRMIDEMYYIEESGKAIKQILRIGEKLSLNYTNLTINDVFNLAQDISLPYYSFCDRMSSLLLEALVYFNTEYERSKTMVKAITSDITRLGNSDKLGEIRNREVKRRDKLQQQNQKLKGIFSEICEIARQADNSIYGEDISALALCSAQKNNLLNAFFVCAESGMIKEASEYMNRIIKGHYIGEEYLIKYLDSVSDSKKTFSLQVALPEIESPIGWAYAKLAIASEDTDTSAIGFGHCTFCISMIKAGGHELTSPKEIMVSALVNDNSKETVSLMQKAFIMGDNKAGSYLLHKSDNNLYDENNKMLNFLAAGLNAEACLRLAKVKGKITMKSPAMKYLKLAASSGNMEAIAVIADTIFNEKYSGSKFLSPPKDQIAQTLCDICNLLISKRNNMMKYKEMLGVVMFSQKKYQLAFYNLKGCNSSVSHYCKGYMYQHGVGVSKNRDKAIEEYEKSSLKQAQTELEMLQDELEDELIQSLALQAEGYEEYDEKNDYSSHSSTTSETSGGCFITTAACRALKAKDNCEELEILRRFRDDHICDSSSGQELVYEYYRIGPMIVERIDSEEDSDRIYDFLWNEYIFPSYEYIKAKDFNAAKLIYIKMVKMLCEKYSIQVDPVISDRYSIHCC